MKSFFTLIAVVMAVNFASAQERFELGLGAGTTHPMGGDAFKNAASTGDGHTFWLGYGLDDNWAVELGMDNLDFDRINSKHQAVLMGATYRFLPSAMLHPLVKLGLGSFESKNAADVKTSSMGARAAAGLELEFKYVSLGGLFSYYYVSKSDDAADFKNTQALMPAVFLTFHNLIAADEPAASTSQAEPAKVAPAAPFKDSDGDGVADEDDKCPNTPPGVAVNKIGCSEKENASVRLNVNFQSGKSELASQYNSEIENLAAFMKRFPEAKVEIAGHTDSLGDAAKNQTLSQNRADAVRAALVKTGVDGARVTSKGYGSSRPIADNKTKAGRDQNRRVTAEISIEVDKKK